MHKCFAYICACISCVYSASRGQRKLLGPLEMELLKIEIHHVGSRTPAEITTKPCP